MVSLMSFCTKTDQTKQWKFLMVRCQFRLEPFWCHFFSHVTEWRHSRNEVKWMKRLGWEEAGNATGHVVVTCPL